MNKRKIIRIIVCTILLFVTISSVAGIVNNEKILDEKDYLDTQEPSFADSGSKSTIYVDDNNTQGPWNGTPEHPYQYIQDGIDNANYGDTVFVFNGTYYENILMKSGVVIQGEGADITTIDGNYIDTVVIAENVDSAAKLDGFTITKGKPSRYYSPYIYGAGINCIRSSPTISNNIISGNVGYGNGGSGISCYYASPLITNNTISENTQGWGGGGIYSEKGTPTITYNNIVENTIISGGRCGGGGIFLWESSATIAYNNISGNSATGGYGSGGGISMRESCAIVYNNIISENTVDEYGGGIECYYDSMPIIINNIISGNSVHECGGGIYCFDSKPKVIQNLIIENSALPGSGGGFYAENYDCRYKPIITNCVFWGNTANNGGGIYNYDVSPIITNCVLWEDTPYEIYNYGSSSPVVTYCDVKDGYPGEGNINVTPLFIDPGTNDFHLQAGSPCIDAGCNLAPRLPHYDFDGDPRILDGNNDGEAIVDIGVDEYVFQPSPGINISMYPDNPPVIVYPGDTFTYTGILMNNDPDNYQTTDVWIMLDVPGQGMYGPIKQLYDVVLPRGCTLIYYPVYQNVPEHAPHGTYRYIAYCGEYHWNPNNWIVMDIVEFEFTVTAPTEDNINNAMAQSAAGIKDNDWTVFGWDIVNDDHP